MPIKKTLNKGANNRSVSVQIHTDNIDSQAMDQLSNIAQLPFIHHHIAAMPDVHLGKGATVGSVIPTRGAIIPAAYKDIDKVMKDQHDLVEIVHTLKQVICVKD